ncbi:interleukin-8-like [Chiloscyllium plagiosum]|uniref:interleukin-8-like n=1 Tax=Chiloscyllium plagiosum TaxID=36176 RepID=UPI001CB7B004|nr:interleukin-8-like [Chiloscyllium plagiosum]
MKIQMICLLLGTVVICFATHGLCVGMLTNSRCKCAKVISNFIHPRRFQDVNIFYQGSFCRKVEIIITLKGGKKVCVDPTTPWIKRVISNFNKRPVRTKELITEESST